MEVFIFKPVKFTSSFLIVLHLLLMAVTAGYGQSPKIDSLKTILSQNLHDTARVNVLNDLCWELRRSDPATGLKYAASSRELLDGTSFPRGEMSYFKTIGVLYMEGGNYDTALYLFNRSLEIAGRLKDQRALATVYGNMGLVYRKKTIYEKALEYQLRSLKIKEALGDKKGMALTYGNIGTIYWEQAVLDTSFYGKALEYYIKNLNLALELGDQRGMGSAYNNVAIVYGNRKMYDLALDFHSKSLKIREKLGDKKGVALSNNNVGLIYFHKGNYDKALDCYFTALRLFEELNDNSSIASACVNLGNAFGRKNDTYRAELYLSRALSISTKIGARDILLDVYKNFTQLYAGRGDYQKAYSNHLLFTAMKDSIFNTSGNMQLKEMQTKYETEKKEQQIELLSKDTALQGAQLRQQRILIWSAVGGLVLVILFFMLMFSRWRVTQRQKKIIESQKKLVDEKNRIVEEKNKDITDSINYAKKIQEALLPDAQEFSLHFPESFVFFRPKDIVSGDFYWLSRKGHYIFYATADCTGHGVPGGFMSMLGSSLLNEIVNEKNVTEPADILDLLRVKIIHSLRQKGESGESKDGMDMCLCRIDMQKHELVYAAANNPVWVVSRGELKKYPADKQPVGISVVGDVKQFGQRTVALETGDWIYTFTDGYADQFGGEKGKKFKYKQIQEKLLSVNHLPAHGQRDFLETTFEKWKGNHDQVDDVLIIGVQFKTN